MALNAVMRTNITTLALALLALAAPACNRPTTDGASSANKAEPSVAAAAPTAPAGGAVQAGERVRRVFTANYGNDTVSVLEGAPVEMEVRTLSGFDSPIALAIRPTEPTYLAVANNTAPGITLIDAVTLQQTAVIETEGPTDDVAFSPDGKTLYALHISSGVFSFIDVETRAASGEPLRFGVREPRQFAVEADGKRIFLLLVTGESAEIAVVDAKTRKLEEKRISVDSSSKALSLGNQGRSLVAAGFDNSNLTVVDVATLSVTATHDAETGMGVSVHPSKPIAYSMVSFDDEVHVVDLETGETIKTFSAGRFPTYSNFSPDGRYLYVPHEDSDSIVKVDTETNEVVAKMAVGKEPVAVVVFEP